MTDPLANPPAKAAPARDFKPRVEPKFEARTRTKVRDQAGDRKLDAKAEPRPSQLATPGKNLYENLEEEMASLLGRPPGKT